MALSRVKVWVAETLTASDLNAEFNNILDNALSLISPLTGSLDCGGYDLTALDELALNNAGAGATGAGRLRRNATRLTWHDGTAARDVGVNLDLHTCGLRLVLSGTNLTVSKVSGIHYRINGTVYQMTGSAPTLAASGTTVEGAAIAANTTYYIYINTSGTLAFSTTGYTINANGEPLRTGDNTRLLLGLARTTAGTAWADTTTQRFVISYFNRRGLGGLNRFTVDRTTTSTTYVELNSEIRVEFVTWSDESVMVGISGGTYNSGAASNRTAVGIDGATPEDTMSVSASGGVVTPIGISLVKSLSEGYHYATVLGRVAGNTGTWYGSGVDVGQVSLTVGIRG